jgi:hypothetical protein
MALAASMGDAFLDDNLAYDVNGDPLPLTAGDIVILKERPSWPGQLVPLPSSNVVDYVTRHAGARPKERDEIDRRIIGDFLNRKGRIIDSQDEVGGYPDQKETHHKLIIPSENIGAWLSKLANELE